MKRRTLFVCLALCVMTALWTVLPVKALEPEGELPVISSAPEESEESAVPEEPEKNAAPEMLEEAAAEPVPQAARIRTGSCGENLTWTLESDGTLRISGTGAMDDYSYTSTLPWNYTLLKTVVIEEGVTSVGKYAFHYCNTLQHATIADSVKQIGECAFSNCSQLTGVTLPGAVSIGVLAFEECQELTGITLPDSVTSIGTGAFRNCRKLTGVTIPSSLTTISKNMFYGCTGLTGVEIPSNVTSIGFFAFAGCSALTSLTIPASVTQMDRYAFQDCTGLTSAGPTGGEYRIQFGWTDTIPDDAFYGHNGLIRAVIPNSITSIGRYAFQECTALTSVEFPQRGDFSIGASAFSGCKALDNIALPDGTSSIGSGAFSDCSSLTDVAIPDHVASIGSSAFYNCANLAKVTVPASVVNLDRNPFLNCPGLTSAGPIGGEYNYEFGWTEEIPQYAFSGCDSLTSITLPEGIADISKVYFDNCVNLSHVVVPNSVTTLGSATFQKCEKLTSAGPIGGGYNYEFGWTERIPERAFSGCGSLTSITLPEGITGIGSYAFSKCTGLTAFTVPGSVTAVEYYTFEDCTSLTSVVISDGVTRIYNYAFDGCTALTSLTVPASVTNIASYAFAYNTGLTSAGPIGGGYDYEFGWTEQIPDNAFSYCNLLSATLPDGVTGIGTFAFRYCRELTSLTVPASVTSIASGAFTGCSGLTSAGPIGGGYDYEFGWKAQIPNYAFLGCEGLTRVELPDGVAGIGRRAFYDCAKLTSLTVPASMASISYDAFLGCSSLTSAGPIGGGYNYEFGWKDQIPNNAFYGCTNLTSVKLPDGVTSIGNNAFYNCTKLTSLTVPASVTSMGTDVFTSCSGLTSAGPIGGGYDYEFGWKELIPENAFYGCTGLTSAKLPNGVTGIGNKAFYNCTKLTSLTVPASVTDIAYNTFDGCTGLTSAGPIGLGYSYSFGWTDSIPDNALSGCKNLVRVRFPAGITSIGQRAFYNCSSLTDVTIPAGVTSIGQSAFYNCSSLTGLTIPASVNSIDTDAFRNCSKLTDIYYTGSEDQWNAIEKSNANIPKTAAIHYNQSGGTGGTVTPEIPADAERDVIFVGSVTWNEEDQSYTIKDMSLLGTDWKVTDQTVLEGANSLDELLDRYMLVEYIRKSASSILGYTPVNALRLRPVQPQIETESSTNYTNRRLLYHTLDGVKVDRGSTLEAGTGKLEEWNGRLAVIDGRDYYVCADTVASLPPAGTTVGFSKVKGTSTIVELSAREYETKTGMLASYDRSKGTAVISGQAVPYQVNTFEYEADLTDYVGKEVFFLLANGEIVHMDALERARYGLSVRMRSLDLISGGGAPARITYEHGQFSRSSFRYQVTLSNEQTYQYPDRYQRFYKKDVVLKAVTDAGLDQPITLDSATWSGGKGLQMGGISIQGVTLQPKDTIVREITAVITPGYRPSERSERIYTTLTVTSRYSGKDETERVSRIVSIEVSNKDYQPLSKNPGTSTPVTVDAAHKVAAELDKIPTNALGLNMNTLKQLFEVDGTARELLEKELLTAVVLSDLPEETFKDRVKDKVLKKIWKEYKPEVSVGSYVLCLPYRFQTKKYGQLSVTFNCEVMATGLSGSTYAKYISVDYEVSNPPSGFYPSSGYLGGGVSVDLAEFRKSVSSLVEEELKGAFDNAWGNSADEVADLLFGQTLQKIMKARNTSVSQITWNLLTWPAKKLGIFCPVDVFVYDADNVLQGSIENGVVTKASENFTLAVEGEAKYITGLTDGYTVRYEATDAGYMNVTVEEQGGIGQPLRQISHYDVPLQKERAYTQSVTAELQRPKEDYDLISQTGQRLQADEDLPLFNLELNYGLPDVSLYDWATAGNRTTVTLLDHGNVLGDGGTVWAARYDGDGRLAELAQGTLANRTAKFDRPLSQDWWVFIWNGACRPLGPKLLLTSESRAS